MDFNTIQETYRALTTQLNANHISWEDFNARVNSMQARDTGGRLWQIDPRTGKWLSWNGSAWQANTRQSTAQPQKKIPAKSWNSFSIIGGIIAALVYFAYSSANSIRSLIQTQQWPGSDRPDLITPFIIAGMPLLFLILRKPLDKLLLPLKFILKPVPRFILIGLAIALPFAIAIALYNFRGLNEYKYLRVCVMAGGFVSYAILRAPQAK